MLHTPSFRPHVGKSEGTTTIQIVTYYYYISSIILQMQLEPFCALLSDSITNIVTNVTAC